MVVFCTNCHTFKTSLYVKASVSILLSPCVIRIKTISVFCRLFGSRFVPFIAFRCVLRFTVERRNWDLYTELPIRQPVEGYRANDEIMDKNNNNLIDWIFSTLLNLMFPIKMLLKAYSLSILFIDIMWVMVNAACAILQSVYQLFKPPPLKSVRLETALVIGAGRGVGRELAVQLANLGAIVLCVDINASNNDDTVQLIKKAGGSAASYNCDITKVENVQLLAKKVKKDIGFVSMLFYCCGIPSPRSLLTQPPSDIHDTLDLTLTSYFWLIDEFVPEMKAKNRGHIVALTSVAGLSHIKGQLPLSVAQFAVQGLAESLREDFRINKKDNVHVSLIHIYPFIVNAKETPDLRFRIPSYFGTIAPEAAASSILDSVRRNYVEVSIPRHLLYLGHLLRMLPRKATELVRELLDTGVDFA